MSFFTMVFIVSILGAIIGIKKPWMGGAPGVLMAPFLYDYGTSNDIIILIIGILFLILLGLAYGFIFSIVSSGLKGSGQRVGQTFMSGFGAHHPGGIILSDEELKIFKDKNIKREVIFSF